MENKIQKSKRDRTKNVFVDMALHLSITALFSVLIYLKTGNVVYAGIFISGGVLLDLDHLIDYFIFFRSDFNLKYLFKGSYLQSGKVYLFLHSWELNIIILALALSMKSYGLFIFFLSLSIHLVIDNIPKRNWLFYFIIYRMYKNFDTNILLPEYMEKFSREETEKNIVKE